MADPAPNLEKSHPFLDGRSIMSINQYVFNVNKYFLTKNLCMQISLSIFWKEILGSEVATIPETLPFDPYLKIIIQLFALSNTYTGQLAEN